ncbi:MAG: hypothetical protein AAGE84_13635 [Cyanobacteria bacterium P01_G01_bin.39]
MPSLVTERIESVKAGIIGAAAFSVTELVILIIKSLIIDTAIALDLTLLVQLAIGMVSGFLFGVTYRYIIREDRNSHLNEGAVLAFGLVRGLALIEPNLQISELLSGLWLITQSIIGFAIARYILDLAITRKLIKPFH